MTQIEPRQGPLAVMGMVNLYMNHDPSAPQEIAHAGTRNLFRYWESIRGERSAPLRSEISLQPIRHLLPWIFICEPVAETSAHRFRLVGTGVCQLWGENMTGKDLFAAWSKFERETMSKLLHSAATEQQPFVMRCRARTETSLLANLEIMGLPVEADDTGEKQVLGLVVPFQDPELYRGHRLVSFDLVSIRIIWTEPLPQSNNALASAPKTVKKLQPNLQLIRGGRDEQS
jgi:hypothetical protein